jgi:putative component of membrane protein insertase Oxa1/YidC/SpoIIIJ protein YidD
MADQLPSEEEQKEAERYVLEKEMIRPKTNILTVIKYYFVFLTSTLGVTVLIYAFLRFCFPGIALAIQKKVEGKPVLTCLIIFGFCHIAGILIAFKSIVIGFVHLYQHYSPEEVRRNCLFKPTCSEYLILAIEKYGLIKGINLFLKNRLTKCNGNIYRIDYP